MTSTDSMSNKRANGCILWEREAPKQASSQDSVTSKWWKIYTRYGRGVIPDFTHELKAVDHPDSGPVWRCFPRNTYKTGLIPGGTATSKHACLTSYRFAALLLSGWAPYITEALVKFLRMQVPSAKEGVTNTKDCWRRRAMLEPEPSLLVQRRRSQISRATNRC
jgi:hypothetical protein